MSVSRWELFKDEVGEWRFRFVASNNEIISQSEGYKNRSDAEHAIDVIESAVRGTVGNGGFSTLHRVTR